MTTDEDTRRRWQELMELLAPVHQEAALAARRIARSSAEGDDLFQEAVLRAMDKLPSLRDRARFRAWFHQILFSVHRTRCRRSFWRRLVPLGEPAGGEHRTAVIDPVGEDGAAWPEERASADRAARALATLSPEQREAIVLQELHGYSLEEVAELQSASLTAVKTRVSRGRERLRQFYRRQGAAPPAIPVTAPEEEEPRDCSKASA